MSNLQIRLHIREFHESSISVSQIMESVNIIFSQADISVDIITDTPIMDAPDNLLDLCIGVFDGIGCAVNCSLGAQSTPLTKDHARLFKIARDADVMPSDIVVCIVRQILPNLFGCSKYQVGKPGLVLSADTPEITLAHELGHVLGLQHAGSNPGDSSADAFDKSRLMHEFVEDVNFRPPDTIPILTDNEIEIVRNAVPTIGSLPNLWFNLALPAPHYQHLTSTLNALSNKEVVALHLKQIAQVAPPRIALSAVRLSAHLGHEITTNVAHAGVERMDAPFVRAAAAEVIGQLLPTASNAPLPEGRTGRRARSTHNRTTSDASEVSHPARVPHERVQELLKRLREDKHPAVKRAVERAGFHTES